jgi:alpha-glucosidase
LAHSTHSSATTPKSSRIPRSSTAGRQSLRPRAKESRSDTSSVSDARPLLSESQIRTDNAAVDYIYTAIYKQNQTGTPALNPLFFNYPNDPNTYPIDLQFFYGDGILVSPVTEENSTSVNYYLPDDIFYEWGTGNPVRGHGAYISAEVDYTDITVHYKGGIVYPQRIESANTTTALRKKGFNIVIAPGLDDCAEGSLYLDDGESVVQDAVSEIDFKYAQGKLSMTGSFEYKAGVTIEAITVLGVEREPKGLHDAEYDAENKKLVLHVDVPLTGQSHIRVV